MIDVTENIINTSALDNHHCDSELETNFNTVKKLFGPLRVATTDSCVVIAQSLWQQIEPVALLPAILHGPSADELNFLSLNASFTLFPFTQADWATVQSSIFDIEAVHYSRKCARRNRYQENRAHQRDLEPPDWEIGYENNRDELYGKRLSATSFLSIESIQPGGNARHHPRPVIGRYTMRRSQRGGWCPPRPELLIAGRHCMSAAEAAIRKLINTDVLIVNLQQLYGPRSLSLARALLAARGPQRPTLIISSRPSELVFFDSLDLLEQATAIPLGSSLGTPQVETVLVGRERPQYEREYEILLRQLKGVSPVHDYLVQMGIRAWWSANQALNDDVTNDSSVYRFLSALDQRASSDGDEATDFKAFRRLLLQILGNHRRIEERTEAISNLVFEHLNCGHGDIVIIVRTPTSVKVVTEWLANQLECRLFELEEWGIFVTTARVLTANDHIGLTIACGFSGVTSLDALLSTRATRVALIVDPIEASLVISSAHQLIPWIDATGESAAAIKSIAVAAEQIAIRGDLLDVVTVDVDYQNISSLVLPRPTRLGDQGPEVIITLLDGDELVVEAGRRFDRLDPRVGTIRSVPACSLEPGFEILLTNETAQFSERLISVLDETVFCDHAARRRAWIKLVEVVVNTKKLKKTHIHRQLSAQGVKVDYQTVRAWTSPTEDDDRVPARWEHFCALSHVIGLELSEAELGEFFHAVRVLRIQHRKAGRDLVRLMRAARTGRLDPVTLHRVETKFGISVRELVASTRVVTIDDIRQEGVS